MKPIVRSLVPGALLAMIIMLAGCMVAEKPTAEDTQISVSRRVAAGFEYLQMDKPSEARRHISRALEHNPRSAEAHNAMALLYKYEGDNKRAEDHFRRALRFDRNYSLARNNYGALLMQQRRFNEALNQFSAAADDPSYDRRAIAFENKGRALATLDRFDEALDAFNTSLRLDSRAPEPLLEVAWIHFRRDQLRVADNLYRRYVERVGSQPPRGLWLGIQLAAKQNDADRLGSFELALQQLYPGSPEHREWRAWVARGRQ
ncbi:MAG: type IV pilus biogenesis/stability protein PilW [Alcanivoracaceae bacterium]